MSTPKVSLGTVARPRAAESVAAELRASILAGALAPGDTLPPEPALADRFGVSRLTVREATQALVAQGLIHVRQGEGTRVLHFRDHAGADLLPILLEQGRVDSRGIADLLAMRRQLAAEVVAQACVRATPDDIAHLRALAAEQRERAHDPAEFLDHDLEFNRATVRAAHSVVFDLFFNAIQPIWRHMGYAVPEQSLPLYDAAIQLIEAGDTEAARARITTVMEQADHRSLERLRGR